MNQLQQSLRLNALFSGVSGLALITFNKTMADLFGVNASAFWIIGLTLIFFTITIIYEIKKQRRLAVLWIITQDFIWVIGSLFILLASPFGITKTGHFFIVVIAFIVLLMGINQFIALQKTKHLLKK